MKKFNPGDRVMELGRNSHQYYVIPGKPPGTVVTVLDEKNAPYCEIIWDEAPNRGVYHAAYLLSRLEEPNDILKDLL